MTCGALSRRALHERFAGVKRRSSCILKNEIYIFTLTFYFHFCKKSQSSRFRVTRIHSTRFPRKNAQTILFLEHSLCTRTQVPHCDRLFVVRKGYSPPAYSVLTTFPLQLLSVSQTQISSIWKRYNSGNALVYQYLNRVPIEKYAMLPKVH